MQKKGDEEEEEEEEGGDAGGGWRASHDADVRGQSAGPGAFAAAAQL